MKTKGIVLAIIMLTGMIFLAAQPVLAGCEVASLDDLIALNANAPGTKYEGPLTVYFQPNGAGSYNMYAFLRLRKGWLPYAFSGMMPDLSPSDFRDDPLVVTSFFMDTVMPGLYPTLCVPGEIGGGDNCPNVAFKSYTLDVSQDDPPGGSSFYFYIVDIVLAVQD